MKILQSGEGELEIVVEEESEWFLLDSICNDAALSGDDWLADRLSETMDEESCWDDIVTPELSEKFRGQVQVVKRALAKAFQEAVGKDQSSGTSILIKKEEAEEWYGALNQAGLVLESEFKLSEIEDYDPAKIPGPALAALGRSQFYLRLKSYIFTMCMED